MNLTGIEHDEKIPTKTAHEDFAVNPDEVFKQAVEEIDETPTFNWRKRKGQELQDRADDINISDNGQLLYPVGGTLIGAGVGLGYGMSLPTADLSNIQPFLASFGSIIGGTAVGAAYKPVKKGILGKAGSYLENNSGSIQVRSDGIDEIKSVLSDPSERPNNMYAVDLGGSLELHDKAGVETVIDDLAEEYSDAEWRMVKDDENPFQVIGMTLDDELNYEEGQSYDQRRRIAESVAEASIGIDSIEEVLETEAGAAPFA